MSIAVFPFTPGYTHGEAIGYAVTVHQFEDGSEQRYLDSRQQGLRLSYDFTPVDSITLRGITSFFEAQGGQATYFNVVDHRTATTYQARFADATLSHDRAGAMVQRLQANFLTVTISGMDPIAVTFSRAPIPVCVISAQVTVTTPTLPPDPLVSSGTIMATGNTLQAPDGADYFFWRQISHSILTPWYIGNQLPRQDGTLSAPGNFQNNRLYAMPFINVRSGATTGELGLSTTTTVAGATVRVGIYEARSSATVNAYPGNLLLDAGTISINALGIVTVTASQQLANGLYFLVCVKSTAGLSIRAATNTDRIMLGLDSTDFTNQITHYVMSYGPAALPTPFPDPSNRITSDIFAPPGILVRFLT